MLQSADYVYQEAVKITESILFVKQHSLRCIAASLFVMSMLYQDFDKNKVYQLIYDMFSKSENEIRVTNEIKNYIYSCYSFLMYTYQTQNYDDYKDVLIEMLFNLKNDEARQIEKENKYVTRFVMEPHTNRT